MAVEYMLTTTDNPYDPFTQFKEWYNYDEMQGYHTCSYLDRMAHTSPLLDDETNALLIDQAMDRIVEFNLYGNYKKVSR